jgi:hypothetical protein
VKRLGVLHTSSAPTHNLMVSLQCTCSGKRQMMCITLPFWLKHISAKACMCCWVVLIPSCTFEGQQLVPCKLQPQVVIFYMWTLLELFTAVGACGARGSMMLHKRTLMSTTQVHILCRHLMMFVDVGGSCCPWMILAIGAHSC